MGLCDNCALKYADCKGNKDKEKCRCDYYKKPVVMNVKELAEKVAWLEIRLEHCRRAVWQSEAIIEGYRDMAEHYKWVPVTERLPEIEDGSLISESVLGTDSYGNIRHVRLELRYGEPRFCTEEEGMGLNIIAWMPLPKPYKDGGTK